MNINDFNYELPETFIAQETTKPRDHSKLMVIKNNINDKDFISHKKFYELIDYLNKNDVLVINETRVMHCRVTGKKVTGGPVELTLTKRIDDYCFECHVQARNPKVGQKHIYDCGLSGELIELIFEDVFIVKFSEKVSEDLIKQFGMPLPP